MINIFMPVNYAYPFAPYVQDQPLFLKFFVSTYSVKNTERTRNSVQNRAAYTITLPLPSDVGYAAAHEFGQGWTPIAPITGFTPNILNNGGKMKNGEIDTSNYDAGREYSSVSFIQELQNLQSSTFKKFSNVTELTMVSEARKRYEFKYIFAPKNQREAVTVEQICGTFKKTSYPTAVAGLPERTFPQNLWSMEIIPNTGLVATNVDYTSDWLGDPLVCVLTSVTVKKNDKADPVVRLLPTGHSNITLLSVAFEEFETGTWDPETQSILSKSELSAKEFPND
jgi:hypothetical protein